MLAGLLGTKQGMTRMIDDQGTMVAVTVVRVEPNEVIRVKTTEKDGKNAIVVGTRPYKKPTKNKKFQNTKEFTVAHPAAYTAGQKISVELLQDIKNVTLAALSKGKGFQGVIKRHGFHGGPSSHGSHFHREPGSIGQRALPGKVQKGKKLPGHMGYRRITLKNRPVQMVDVANNTVLVVGAVPGSRNTLVEMTF